jgi:hypothetical protein
MSAGGILRLLAEQPVLISSSTFFTGTIRKGDTSKGGSEGWDGICAIVLNRKLIKPFSQLF